MFPFAKSKRPSAVRRIILHVGHDKCGSKAIQRFIQINQDALASAGFETTESTKISRYDLGLKAYAGDVGSIREFQARRNAAPVAASTFRKTLNTEIRSELEGRSVDTLLWSFEGLLYLNAKQIRHLVSLMSELADEVDIFAVVRRQDRHGMSGYTTRLRNLAFTRPALLERDDGSPVGLDYFVCLENWRKAVGREHLHVVAYEDYDNIVRAYADYLVQDLDVLRTAPPENTSLSAEGQEILRRFNADFADKPPWAAHHQELRVTLRAILPAGPSRRPSRTEADRLLAHYHKSNARLLADYLPENTRFNDELIAYPETADIPDVSDETVRDWLKAAAERAKLEL